MNTRRKISADPLSPIMQEKGLDTCPEGLSARLTEMTVRSYKRNYSAIYKREEWPGKIILAILLLLNSWMLYVLVPGHVHPVLIAGLVGFIIATFVLIRLNKSLQQPNR
ncbi:hypothetical protein [Chitinophaga flava]|uniref:Uncharacterized protein n=1 Tax=Chitinophaga flava TaxID=2259036 RepID=A0A365XXY7_9BACT|nr:hypothetical protein [Chitinophaga flava]RBL91249.1 hypothetical protein DF182_01085 [Chitinophaga flava]